MATRLRLARTRSGLTQEVVASRIGLSRVHITNLESGRFDLSLRTLLDLSDLYQVSTDWLLAREPLSTKEIELGDLYEEREHLRAVMRRTVHMLQSVLDKSLGDECERTRQDSG